MILDNVIIMNTEYLASNLLELSSESRLEILNLVRQNPLTLSELHKKTKKTGSEIHRNLQRLLDSKVIDKDNNGKYRLSNFGQLIMFQLHSFEFLATHKDFWKIHTTKLPEEFLRRLGDLSESKTVSGFVAVQEIFQKIYQNSNEYIYSMLQEAPYDGDTVAILLDKLKTGVHLHSLFSEDSVISEKREFVKSEFLEFIKNGNLERRICDSFPAVVFCNEKEGCVCFSDPIGRIDLGMAFYGNSKSFQKWCFDYSKYFWDSSKRFSEEKLGKF